jgi:hypothetical protein
VLLLVVVVPLVEVAGISCDLGGIAEDVEASGAEEGVMLVVVLSEYRGSRLGWDKRGVASVIDGIL